MLLVLAALAQTARAEALVSRTRAGELEKLGVDPLTARPIEFSDDGRTLLLFQSSDTQDKARGFPVTLILLSLGSDASVQGARRILLPVPSIEALALTADARSAVLLTQSGASFYVVDLETGGLRPLMLHKPGQPGFRADPSVLWRYHDQLYTIGYFYDQEDYAEDNVIAAIDPSRTGVEAFRGGPNVYRLQRSLEGLHFSGYLSPSLGFLGDKRRDETVLFEWRDGSPLKEIDRASAFLSFWGEDERLLYTARRPTGVMEVVLYDASSGQRQILANDDKTTWGYVVLAKDGTAGV
ncbi:MAG TPA: hypothetical protein VNO81_13380, partial [Candidatus Nitrosotenuis sp.]|nr:hypothetical protein [Candidatus Nitrosotenuis sp.]